MDSIVVPDREELTSRLRQIVNRTPPRSRGPFDELEIQHLVEVACNHGLLLADIFRDDRAGRVLRSGKASSSHLLAELAGSSPDPSAETLRQMRRVPDEIKMVGDKCLYDVGLIGRSSHDGHDLVELGRRSYLLASQVLEVLAEDGRLRDFFRQNLLWNLPIEEEVVFLRQCGARFEHHADLLRNLRLQHLNHDTRQTEENILARDHGTTPADRPNRPGDISSMPPVSPAAPVSGSSGFEGLKSRGSDSGFAGGMMEERPEFLNEELPSAAGVAEMDRLPRKDLLSLYERMLLFSSLDIEDLRAELKRVVIDQQDAVDQLCDELSLYATGTQSLSRPASYFFVGPTGVGKNHLVESLVRALEKRWDFQIPMLQLEGPQYTYPSDINELKGAARGFIRSDEEGILTEFYSRSSQSPYSVILVDEVEKSHPQLRKFFLSLMDRGTTMDNRGQMLNFVNSMIVYTSNIGYSRLQTSASPIGFREEAEQQNLRDQEVMRDLKKILSPEFVNRLTIIRFGALSRASIESIFDLEFERIALRYMTMHGLELTVTPRARLELLRRGYNPEFGARPMARLLNVVCNIEVSKKLKRDEIRSPRADRTLRDYIREVKEGKRAYDPQSVQRRVMSTARIQVPYKGIAVDYDGGEFLYLPQGRERGSH
jgi:hypothetical protein